VQVYHDKTKRFTKHTITIIVKEISTKNVFMNRKGLRPIGAPLPIIKGQDSINLKNHMTEVENGKHRISKEEKDRIMKTVGTVLKNSSIK
jgi:hypothetical protein